MPSFVDDSWYVYVHVHVPVYVHMYVNMCYYTCVFLLCVYISISLSLYLSLSLCISIYLYALCLHETMARHGTRTHGMAQPSHGTPMARGILARHVAVRHGMWNFGAVCLSKARCGMAQNVPEFCIISLYMYIYIYIYEKTIC